MAYDLIIRGGTVADGTGAPARTADVGVTGGRISEVGRIPDRGAPEIDADGLLVTPGFVDIHSHYDGQAMWDERLLSAGWQGVTTTVMGNCGVGFAPVRESDRRTLIELMAGVEDIPATALDAGLGWDWRSFPDYLDAVESRPHDIDIAAQLPHSALRVFVMGDRAVRREAATPVDRAEMRRLAAEAVAAGALGFSTSHSQNHRTLSGDSIPSLGATADELAEIALGLRDAGRGVLQIVADFTPEKRAGEFAMIRRMAAESGRPLSLTLLQRNCDPGGWRAVLAMLEDAIADGLNMRAQITPRPLGTLFGLDLGRHPFCYHPSWQDIAHRPHRERVALMRDPAFRERLLSEQPQHEKPHLIRRVRQFEYLFRLEDPPDYAPPRARSIAAIAEAEGRTPDAVAYDLLMEDDGNAMLFAPDIGFAGHSLEGCRELIEHPATVIGVSDGGAHVAHISDVSFSTFMLSYWGRDRPEGALDLAGMVRKVTSDTAAAVGLRDRGVLAPGYKADINVIDFASLRIERPYMVFDLPEGGKRLLQKARGFAATIVAGVPVYRNGEATGALPGRLVRGAQAPPVN